MSNVSAEAYEVAVHTRIGWLRSVYNIFHAFSVGAFIDELAHAKNVDPIAMWHEVHGPARKISLAELGTRPTSSAPLCPGR